MNGESMVQSSSEVVINGIGTLIAKELAALAGEHWQPRFTADQSDAELNFRRERVRRLRAIREEFENLMHGLERTDT